MSDTELATLLADFHDETYMHSSMVSVEHKPSVQALIKAGLPVVEFVFRNAIPLSYHLMWVLGKITGENPVKPEHAGMIAEMSEAWNIWATQNNYR